MKYLVFIVFACSFYDVQAQNYNPVAKPDTYKNTDNPNYWKNKMPFAGYWQQDVYYNITANIDETTDIIDGVEQLTYWNNSPDDLEFVYFHLYQNAFQPGSHYHGLHQDNKIEPHFGKYEREGKGTEMLSIRVNGKDVKVEYDNTVVKVYLNEALKSGTSVTFDITFKTYFDTGSIRRRMKKFKASGYTHYDGVHWYPRISVYDRKFGWTTDQHLGREFYGDFGTFDVELTFSSNYVVEATGKLINEPEVLPKELKSKLDVKNFKDKPWGEKATEITPYNKEQRKTWKYHAENVHDFAFTADPTYRIGETYWNGVQCVAVVQEPHASKWQNAADYTAKIIQTFSEDIGMYVYNKMVVADAEDGMEYPMLTLDGGSDPGYRDLLVHEIGHNWFYGQVGTNETYRAFMDEGFTQFLTAWGLEHIDGDTLVEAKDQSTYKQWFREPSMARDQSTYVGYLMDAMVDDDAPLNTHSDDFGAKLRHGGGYRHVYYKTGTMLYNLQYVLGDSLFLAAMQHYFNTWKIAHPYPEDFRNSMIQFTKVDLNWFFDQWLETTKNIDYKIVKHKKIKDSTYELHLKRKGDMQMPLDVQVLDKKGGVLNYHIPNTWFVKDTKASVLPKWTGWGGFNRTYTTEITVPDGIERVEIDPSKRLADVNMLNNKTCTPTRLLFDHKLQNPLDRNHYLLSLRPDFWYNGLDGLKLGMHFNGHYLKTKHIFETSIWMNTSLFQDDIFNQTNAVEPPHFISYRLNYQTPITKVWKGSSLFLESKYLDGLIVNLVGFKIPTIGKSSHVRIYVKTMYRSIGGEYYLSHLNYPAWVTAKWNNTVNVEFEHHYPYFKGEGTVLMQLKSSSLGSDYNFSYLNLSSVNKNRIGPMLLSTRFFMQYGFGEDWAPESLLYLEGANPEAQADNKYTRSTGVLNALGVDPVMKLGGGLNLRGYYNYFAAEQLDSNTIVLGYRGNSGASINTELAFGRFLKKSKTVGVQPYVFADAGVMKLEHPTQDNFILSDIRMDAGLGFLCTLKKFGPLETIKPLSIRVDFPVWVNRVAADESGYLRLRWIVGISKAF